MRPSSVQPTTERLNRSIQTARCRQPEPILSPPQLTVLLTEPVELGALLTGEQALVSRTGLSAMEACLAHPARQVAGGKAQPFSDGLQERLSCRQRSIASCICWAVNRRL